jgi:hypothetical protein
MSYKTNYETRLLYTQSYLADEAVNVTSDMHAIMWSFGPAAPTTTRVRLTFIYTREAKGIAPVQGLSEQWKNEGWSVVDEYVDGYQEFDEIEDFRAHLLEMTRAFLLGVPFGSEVQGDAPPKLPGRKTGLKIPKPNISSRLDSIIKKTTEDKTDNDKNVPDEDDIYAKGVYVKPERADIKLNPTASSDVDSSDDDDDDDWI